MNPTPPTAESADSAHDHAGLSDRYAAQRYFAKFESIFAHLFRVAAVMEANGTLDRGEVKLLIGYLSSLNFTFRALGLKYLLTGRDTGRFFGSLTMDTRDSGFPVAAELMTMANDAQQSAKHLAGMPSEADLKDDMLRQIIGERTAPTRLQYAMSQRLYYSELLRGDLFWTRNDPQCEWLGNPAEGRRLFRLHWAIYDSQMNLPVIYVMEVEDSGRTALPKDQTRWPELQSHLMAQSLGALKLLTIARGIDNDFDDLHPKRLRRLHLGPMYSSAFTRQSGPLREVLQDARAPEGQDWALAWTVEDLHSERVRQERAGWFSTVEREVFALDPFAGRGAETGTTQVERSIIMPQRPFQVLAERDPPGFRNVKKFVVSAGGRVLQY